MLTALAQPLISFLLSLLLVNSTFGYQDQEKSQDQPQRGNAGRLSSVAPLKSDELKIEDFEIKYLKPSELEVVLKPLMSKSSGATITPDDKQKILWVRHTEKWLGKIAEIIAELDVPPGPERQVTLNMQIIMASTVEGRGNTEAEQWREVTKKIPQESHPFKSFYALPPPISIGATTGQGDVKKEGQFTVSPPFVDSPTTVSYKVDIAEVLNDESAASSGVTLKGLNFVMTAADPSAPSVSLGSPISRKTITLKPNERLLVLPDRASERQIILILALALTTQ